MLFACHNNAQRSAGAFLHKLLFERAIVRTIGDQFDHFYNRGVVMKHPQLRRANWRAQPCAVLQAFLLQPVNNEICSAASRNTSCSGHGRCSTAACTCDPGWEGERCAEVTPQVLSAGHALAFDGSDDFIFAELHENLIANNAMDNFTLMAWIKPEYQGATALDMHIVGHAAEDGPALGLTKGDDGKRRLKVFTFWSRWEADHCTGTVKLNETVIRGSIGTMSQ